MPIIGRFAPSPSGPLHFGSLVAALASYCQARWQQGSWLLRIEDVDTPRVVAGAAEQICRDLEVFGFEWDGPVLYQSRQFHHYQHYLEQLFDRGACYACECSRRSLREQGVRSGPLGQIYPGNCRDKKLTPPGHSIRLNTQSANRVSFTDRVYGEFSLDLPDSVGDFVIKRVDHIFAYHLAVVIDDYLQQVNEVVRGADLLENTCLHIFLQRQLGFATPDYLHVPLVNDAKGVKLSKQTGATGIAHDRAAELLLAALKHLGQAPAPELRHASPPEILVWATSNWQPKRIPATLPASAETFDQ